MRGTEKRTKKVDNYINLDKLLNPIHGLGPYFDPTLHFLIKWYCPDDSENISYIDETLVLGVLNFDFFLTPPSL